MHSSQLPWHRVSPRARFRMVAPYVAMGALLLSSASGVARPTKSPLVVARACVARADSACVVTALSGAKPTSSTANEHWLTLAFARSRLGQHKPAQADFRAWLALSPKNRLDRGQVPSRIWPDYVAALLAHHGGALDLQPRVARVAKPAKATGSWRDIPRVSPPPRSVRDQANDTEFVTGPLIGTRAGALAAGFSLLVRMHLGDKIQLGGTAQGMSTPAQGGHRDVDIAIGAHGQWQLAKGSWGRLDLSTMVGFAMVQRFDGTELNGVMLMPAIRYARWRHFVGIEFWLADQVLLGDGLSRHVPVIGVGLLVRPGKKTHE